MRRIHLTLWDCRGALPMANGPLRCTRDGRRRTTFGLPYPTDFEMLPDDARRWSDMNRERWLSTRRACTGQWLDSSNQRDMFDSTEDPTCPLCVRLWETVQVLKDARLERAA